MKQKNGWETVREKFNFAYRNSLPLSFCFSSLVSSFFSPLKESGRNTANNIQNAYAFGAMLTHTFKKRNLIPGNRIKFQIFSRIRIKCELYVRSSSFFFILKPHTSVGQIFLSLSLIITLEWNFASMQKQWDKVKGGGHAVRHCTEMTLNRMLRGLSHVNSSWNFYY